VRSESHSGRLNPGQEPRYPFTTMLGGPQRPPGCAGRTYLAPAGCSLDTLPTEPLVPVTNADDNFYAVSSSLILV